MYISTSKYEFSSTQWLLKEDLYVYPFFFTKICFNLQFLCNTIKNMIKLKPRKQTNCNHLLHICMHNWPLQSFSQDYGLAFHTTHVVFVNFIREWQDLQFNVDSER